MKEFVEHVRDPEELRYEAREMSRAIFAEENLKRFAAKYIEHRIVNNETLDYRVEPSGGTAGYAVIEDITGKKNVSANLAQGPLVRLRRHGFMIHNVGVYMDSHTPYTLKTQEVSLSGDNLIVWIVYVGEDHPIIEYWRDDFDNE